MHQTPITTYDGGSAFPLPHGNETIAGTDGMSLRDYLAATIANGDWSTQSEATGEYLNSTPQDD